MLGKSVLASIFVGAMMSATALLGGCNRQPLSCAAPIAKNDVPQSSAEHSHSEGSHGGIIVPLGADSYHAEAVFENGGVLRLCTLAKDQAKIIDIENQTLKAFVKEEGSNQAVPVELAPEPQPGDRPGRTSQFAGKLPEQLVGKSLAVTIPVIAVEGERFRLGFASASTHDAAHTAMPAGVDSKNEEDLYLKPGGIYTQEDIIANGGLTASQKFQGIMAKHDMKPVAGDKICPVTMTKANAKFTWIVAGKAYEFCCPPCVDEFVTMAKTHPEQVMEPAFYVKK